MPVHYWINDLGSSQISNDSEFAAILLRDAGVPAESLSVFPGGITEWKASDLPVEVGARDSGELLGPKR